MIFGRDNHCNWVQDVGCVFIDSMFTVAPSGATPSVFPQDLVFFHLI